MASILLNLPKDVWYYILWQNIIDANVLLIQSSCSDKNETKKDSRELFRALSKISLTSKFFRGVVQKLTENINSILGRKLSQAYKIDKKYIQCYFSFESMSCRILNLGGECYYVNIGAKVHSPPADACFGLLWCPNERKVIAFKDMPDDVKDFVEQRLFCGETFVYSKKVKV